MAMGAAGSAVLTAVVEIGSGVLARFVAVKLNGPPKLPKVIFCNVTVGGVTTTETVAVSVTPPEVTV